MRKIMLCILLSVSFIGSASAGENPILWSYSEGWWDNTTPNAETNCVSDPNQSPSFPVCTDARFTFVTRQTVELNPEANAHGIEINIQIKDLFDNHIVSSDTTSDFWTGNQTLFSAQTDYEVILGTDETPIGPFEGLMNIDVSCNGQMPGGSGTTALGGLATMSFQLLYIQSPRQASYRHIHNPSSTCPSRCRDSVSWAQIVYVREVPSHAIVFVPFTVFGCSPLAGGAGLPYAFACYDTWVNPF